MVSKLLGFENLAIFLRVLESLVSETSFGKFGLKKKYWFRFWKIRSREKSLSFNFGEIGLGKRVSVSENLVLEKKYRFLFWKICYRKKQSRYRSKFCYRHSVGPKVQCTICNMNYKL